MNKLIEEFQINTTTIEETKTDYEIFKDKNQLEKYRLSIIEELADRGNTLDKINKDEIISATDKVIIGEDLSNIEREYLYNLIYEELNGYGPLTGLLHDDNITGIMVNSPNDIYIETDGNIKKDTTISFINDNHINRTINKLLESNNQYVDPDNPICESRLKDGSRINVILPPLVSNPILTIRKYKTDIDNMEELIGDGTLTVDMANFLDKAVNSKMNILISGNIGSGKTTLLNAICNLIPSTERIIAIEDIPELNLNKHHVIKLEAQHNKINEITTNELLKTSLRLNAERIILGEIKGIETLTYIETINSGYKGSIATIFADNPTDAIKKVELLASLSNKDYPIDTIKELIANNIDLIIHISKMKDGHRKITAISTFEKNKDEKLSICNLYEFELQENDKNEIKGEFKKNNIKIKNIEKRFI